MDQRHLFTQAGYNCAEAVLAAVTGSMDHVSCASGFGGGIGGTGETCGAVTGAIMGMGLALGVRDPEPLISYREFRPLVARFLSSFEDAHGSTLCSQLLRLSRFDNEEDSRAYHGSAERKMKCTDFVDRAACLARELVGEVQK